MTPTGSVSGQLTALGRRMEALGSPVVTLGELVDGLGQAGIGMTILLLTLPALIPVPGPFGMVFGSLIAFVSVQLMCGARRLWLPEFVRRRPLPVASVKAMVDRGAPLFGRVEHWLKPRRMLRMTGIGGRMALGAPLLLMGISVALPVPLGNVPPAASLICLALGLMMRDGAAVLLGLVLAVLSALWFALLFFFGAQMAAALWAFLGW